MYKSKSDLARVAVLAMVVAGCDAMRVSEPTPVATPLRAAFTAIVVPGGGATVGFSRPIGAPVERNATQLWFDEDRSKFSIANLSNPGSDSEPDLLLASNGLRAYSIVHRWPDSGTYGFRGVLRWNASTPFDSAAGNTVEDSFDLRPESAEKVEFQTGMVRGEIGLRWPRLARARRESLLVWSKLTDSVSAFHQDWRSICAARGAADDRILALDPATNPPSYRWKLPDTGVVRGIMDGSVQAQTIFATGDSIWVQNRRSGDVFLGLSSEPLFPVWGMVVQRSDSISYPFLNESFSGARLVLDASRRIVQFEVPSGDYGQGSSKPMRLRFQITGVCRSILQWRQYGSTDRSHHPRGNVAPFDGYFCRILPDTISFPRGDMADGHSDTAILSGSKPLVPSTETTRIVKEVVP